MTAGFEVNCQVIRVSSLGTLQEEEWTGSVVVSHRPLFILNVKTGVRQYIQWIEPHEALKLLGIYISPILNWDKSISEINKKMLRLLGASEGAARRREWRIIVVGSMIMVTIIVAK